MSIKLIRVEKKEQINAISEVSCKAYYDDPLFSSFFPEISNRMGLKYLFKVGILHALRYGEIYATSDLKGFAAWVPHQKAIMTKWDMIRCHVIRNIIRKAKGRDLKKIFNYDDFVTKKHKEHANFPHWYLHNIAVEPDYQGRGYGSALIREMLLKIDEQNFPCYLETQNKKNIAMYEKFGFKVLEETTVQGTGYALYFMLRPKVL